MITPVTAIKDAWDNCLDYLANEIDDPEAYHAFIAPLQIHRSHDDTLVIYAPNQFIFEKIKNQYLSLIQQSLKLFATEARQCKLTIKVGTVPAAKPTTEASPVADKPKATAQAKIPYPLNAGFQFDNFITGRSNEFAFAAAQQAAKNPGQSYNPFVIFGSTGLGKTHLMQAIGHSILTTKPDASILYIHAEKFLTEMISALQQGTMNQFKAMLTAADVLMLDDIQFFAHKERSQEELFHRFNEKLELNQQVILTSDRYPKELNGFEDRLKSRFSWGLAVGVDPPELETRVAILQQKSKQQGFELPQEVAFFIADQIKTNVRELEGILTRLLAHAKFSGLPIDVPFTKAALKDLLSIHNRQVSIDQIQQTVARYYKVKVSDITGKRRLQAVTLPRQIAMALAKSLTSKSFPEIGRFFGGRDHTTVLHACQKINKQLDIDSDLKVDYENLVNLLTN